MTTTTTPTPTMTSAHRLGRLAPVHPAATPTPTQAQTRTPTAMIPAHLDHRDHPMMTQIHSHLETKNEMMMTHHPDRGRDHQDRGPSM